MFYAIKNGRFETVEYMIKQGVNIMHQDKKQVTPLQFAKRSNKHQIVELLLANGATPPADAKKKSHAPQTVKNE